ncbi:MAG: cytochrome c oxidase accessory protein CcoG [Myxococcota bacterium]
MSTSIPPDTLATMNNDGSRRWLTPKLSAGKHYGRRRWVAWGLIAIFVTIPFVRIQGTPLLLLELARREFHIFGGTFYANDVALLTLFLLSTFIGIFLLTALFGRVWCGWACPQTVYMEWVFRPLERLFTAKGRKSDPKFAVMKYMTYAVIALAMSHVFLGYFVRIEELAKWVTESPFEHPGAFTLVMGVSGLIFFDFAWFREQMCVVICPYARLQSALLDKNSLIVGYDKARGEPRSKLKVLNEPVSGEKAGDCIDCRACVLTCPTGIDIRNGLQLECIACTQCADACDAIMEKVGRPTGLVRYTNREELDGVKQKKGLRPRLVVYPILLTIFSSLLVVQLLRRAPADVLMLRSTGVPFIETNTGTVLNSVRVRIRNRTPDTHEYRLRVVSDRPVTLTTSQNPVRLEGGQMVSADVVLETPRSSFDSGEPRFSIVVEDQKDPAAFSVEKSDRLLGPSTKGDHK